MIPEATLFKEFYSDVVSPLPSGNRPTYVTNASLCTRNRAYLSIGVTSGIGAGLCGAPGGEAYRGIGAVLYRILDMTFREFLFHELG